MNEKRGGQIYSRLCGVDFLCRGKRDTQPAGSVKLDVTCKPFTVYALSCTIFMVLLGLNVSCLGGLKRLRHVLSTAVINLP